MFLLFLYVYDFVVCNSIVDVVLLVFVVVVNIFVKVVCLWFVFG